MDAAFVVKGSVLPLSCTLRDLARQNHIRFDLSICRKHLLTRLTSTLPDWCGAKNRKTNASGSIRRSDRVATTIFARKSAATTNSAVELVCSVGAREQKENSKSIASSKSLAPF